MEHAKSVLSQLLHTAQISSNGNSHTMETMDYMTSKSHDNQLYSGIHVIKHVSSMIDESIGYLQHILGEDSNFRDDLKSQNETNELRNELIAMKLKLLLAINILKKKIILTTSSFSAISNENDVTRQKIMMNGFCSFFTARMLHLKLIDYQTQLKLNGEKTTRKCAEFLI